MNENGRVVNQVEQVVAPPLLFLDVDGVVNVLANYPGDFWPDWQRAHVSNRVGQFPIVWSPSVTGRLVKWADKGLVEIWWLTTWLDDANGALSPVLGLPHWPVLGSHLTADPALTCAGDAFGWWKADLVDEHLAKQPGRPFVWLDGDSFWNDLLSLVFAGTAWPEGSENAVWDLAQEWGAFADDLSASVEGLQAAATELLAAWDAPAAVGFDDLARKLLGSPDVGVPGHLRNAVAIAQQTSELYRSLV